MSGPEPETDDEEAHVGYDDVEVDGMSCGDDEMDQTADSDADDRDSNDAEIDNVVWTVEVGVQQATATSARMRERGFRW